MNNLLIEPGVINNNYIIIVVIYLKQLTFGLHKVYVIIYIYIYTY